MLLLGREQSSSLLDECLVNLNSLSCWVACWASWMGLLFTACPSWPLSSSPDCWHLLRGGMSCRSSQLLTDDSRGLCHSFWFWNGCTSIFTSGTVCIQVLPALLYLLDRYMTLFLPSPGTRVFLRSLILQVSPRPLPVTTCLKSNCEASIFVLHLSKLGIEARAGVLPRPALSECFSCHTRLWP